MALPLAGEREILADAPDRLRAYRFALAPSIVVLQFPGLAEQAGALNRVAALIEKRGYPRDRVLPRDELDRLIRAEGVTPETFYYGHDYRGQDLLRFFALAAQAGLALTEGEVALQALLAGLGWRDGAAGALISLARENADAGLDAGARATILRHELSHGVYFTDPGYAAHARRFWDESLSATERAGITDYLVRDGYDPALQDLMVNEAQAYLIHTPDRRYFDPAAAGLSEERLAALRAVFRAGMPAGWLRDATPAPRRRAAAPGHGRGLVRTMRTAAVRRALRRVAASRAARSSRR